MANRISLIPTVVGTPAAHTNYVAYYICDTDAGKPVSGLNVGDLCWAVDTGVLYVATSTTEWTTGPIVGNGADPPASGKIGRVNRTGLTAAVASTNLTNGTPAGFYRVSYYLRCTYVGTGTGQIDFRCTFTDDVGATTQSTSSVQVNSTNNAAIGIFVLYLASGNITYEVALISGTIGTSQFQIRVRCEYLG